MTDQIEKINILSGIKKENVSIKAGMEVTKNQNVQITKLRNSCQRKERTIKKVLQLVTLSILQAVPVVRVAALVMR